MTDLEKDTIPRDLQSPSNWVTPNRHDIQRRGWPSWMENELWEGSHQAILNLRTE
jgi:hypothetical protein